jgi:hypothetical protein
MQFPRDALARYIGSFTELRAKIFPEFGDGCKAVLRAPF